MATSVQAETSSTPRTRRPRKSGSDDPPAAKPPKRSRRKENGSSAGGTSAKATPAATTSPSRGRKRKAALDESPAGPVAALQPEPGGEGTPDSAEVDRGPAEDGESTPASAHGVAPLGAEDAGSCAHGDQAQRGEAGLTSGLLSAGEEPEPADSAAPPAAPESAQAPGLDTPATPPVDIPRAPREAPRSAQAQRAQGFRRDALGTARAKFANDPVRSPLGETQIDQLLNLLHEPGKDRSLVSSTWEYLRRGMSSAHATVCIAKLDGTFKEKKVA